MESIRSVEEIRKRERLDLETQVMLVVMVVSTTTLLCALILVFMLHYPLLFRNISACYLQSSFLFTAKCFCVKGMINFSTVLCYSKVSVWYVPSVPRQSSLTLPTDMSNHIQIRRGNMHSYRVLKICLLYIYTYYR